MTQETSKEISHKELLCFSNLTNLEWEFVDIEAIEEGETEYRLEKVQDDDDISTQIKDLLDPEAFIKTDLEGNFISYPYMKEVENEDGVNDEARQKGIRRLRKNAGIAMEYKELLDQDKENSEAVFLKDWEVIYGADNYKVVKDYIDYKWSQICEGINSLNNDYNLDKDKTICPSREELESAERKKMWIKLTVTGASLALSYISTNQKLNNVAGNVDLGGIIKDVAGSLTSEIGKEIAEEHVASSIAMAIIFNMEDPVNILKNSLGATEKQLLKSLTEEMQVNEPEGFAEEPISFDESLDMRDTGFRVVVFKKEEDGSEKIVVAYKGENKKETFGFPQEFELLQIVYNRLRRQEPDAEIVFTGLNRGSDLSFINALFADQREAWIVEKGDTLWDIAEELFGSGQLWQEKLEKEDGTDFEEHLIYPGQRVYYHPKEKKEQLPATLFYTEIDKLCDYLNFTPENLGQGYKPLRQVAVDSLGVGIADFSIRMMVTAAVVTYHLLKGQALASIALKSMVILNVKMAVITILVSLVVDGTQNHLQRLGYEEIYNKLKELDAIKEEEKIGDDVIEGYITDKFIETPYLELEVPYLDEEAEEYKAEKVKIEKEIAMYIIYNRKIDFDDGARYVDVTLRKGETDTIFINAMLDYAGWIKLTKETRRRGGEDGGEYELFVVDGLVPMGAVYNNPIVPEAPGSYSYQYDLDEIPSWEIASPQELKQKLNKLDQEIEKKREQEDSIAEKYAELQKTRYKKQAMASYRQDLDNSNMVMALMEITAAMQRNWKRYRDKLEAFYWDIEAMLEGEEKPLTYSNNLLKFSKEKAKEDNSFQTTHESPMEEHLSQFNPSEFGFIPWVNEEGQIDIEEPELRDEYKLSLFKSALCHYLHERYLEENSNRRHWLNSPFDDEYIKFGPEPLPAYYSYNFGETDLHIGFKEILEKMSGKYYLGIYNPDIDFVELNYYDIFLQEVQDNPEILKNFYKIKEIEEVEKERLILGNFTRVEAEIIIPPEAGEELLMEYKYNPEDNIVGGVLEMAALDIPEELMAGDFSENALKPMNSKIGVYQYAAQNTELNLECDENHEDTRSGNWEECENRLGDEDLLA